MKSSTVIVPRPVPLPINDKSIVFCALLLRLPCFCLEDLPQPNRVPFSHTFCPSGPFHLAAESENDCIMHANIATFLYSAVVRIPSY